MYSAETLTEHLKKYDKNLFAREERGVIHVLVRGERKQSERLSDTEFISYFVPTEHVVLSLTENWSFSGQRRNWGIDRVLFRIKEIDSHKRDLMKEFEEENEKIKKSKERDFQNHNEAFLHEWRDDIKKQFNDVNTSGMTAVDSRRKFEKRSL